jgi:hypothetical protein
VVSAFALAKTSLRHDQIDQVLVDYLRRIRAFAEKRVDVCPHNGAESFQNAHRFFPFTL